MKVSIELTGAQVKGLKAYLKATSSDIIPKITKKDIDCYIREIVIGTIESPKESVSYYIYNNLLIKQFP